MCVRERDTWRERAHKRLSLSLSLSLSRTHTHTPAPFWPMIVTFEPCRIEKFTLSNIFSAAKLCAKLTSLKRMTAGPFFATLGAGASTTGLARLVTLSMCCLRDAPLVLIPLPSLTTAPKTNREEDFRRQWHLPTIILNLRSCLGFRIANSG